MLAAGALTIPSLCLRATPTTESTAHTDLTSAFRSLFDHYRRLGQITGPAALTPVLIGQTNVIQAIGRQAGSSSGRVLLSIAARYAGYTGWLVQETGADAEALAWTERAVDLATAAGDTDFAAYGQVRHALVTLYRGDAS